MLLFYSEMLFDDCINLNNYILNAGKYQKTESNANNNYNNQNPNNFNEDAFIYKDEREKTHHKASPKIYFLPDGKILSTDGDKLSNGELTARIYCTKVINIFNNPNVDPNIRRFENFTSSLTFVNAINAKHGVASGSAKALEFGDNGWIINRTDNPISKTNKFLTAIVYTSAMELSDIYGEQHNIPRPHSRITTAINNNSPFSQTTFSKNDTWQNDLNSTDIVRNCGNNIYKKCDIF